MTLQCVIYCIPFIVSNKTPTCIVWCSTTRADHHPLPTQYLLLTIPSYTGISAIKRTIWCFPSPQFSHNAYIHVAAIYFRWTIICVLYRLSSGGRICWNWWFATGTSESHKEMCWDERHPGGTCETTAPKQSNGYRAWPNCVIRWSVGLLVKSRNTTYTTHNNNHYKVTGTWWLHSRVEPRVNILCITKAQNPFNVG